VMGFDPEKHHRRSIRLPKSDYSAEGACFITICTQQRRCFLGEIVFGEMRLNRFGHVVVAEWLRIGEMRSRIQLDAFVVMPNHIHGVLVIHNGRGTLQRAPTKCGLKPAPTWDQNFKTSHHVGPGFSPDARGTEEPGTGLGRSPRIQSMITVDKGLKARTKASFETVS